MAKARKKSINIKRFSLEKIRKLSIGSIFNYNKKSVADMYKKLQRRMKRSYNAFKRHGREKYYPISEKELSKPAYKMSKSEMAMRISEWSNNLDSEFSSYAEWNRRRKYWKKRAEENLEYKFKNDAEYDLYTEFMNEMYIRDKDNWKVHYLDAMTLFSESRRLNLDPMKFRANYNYWLDNAYELSNAEPLNRKNLKPSDYAKQLKLPKIRGWMGDYDYDEDDE